jgi:hypothetical protein
VECGELAGNHAPSAHRARLWLRHAPRIADDVFIKLYAHGAPEKNAGPMLGGDLSRTFEYMTQVCAENRVALHYVTTWQMWKAIEAVRTGQDPAAAVEGAPSGVVEGH